jgi:hypothetical protein
LFTNDEMDKFLAEGHLAPLAEQPPAEPVMTAPDPSLPFASSSFTEAIAALPAGVKVYMNKNTPAADHQHLFAQDSLGTWWKVSATDKATVFNEDTSSMLDDYLMQGKLQQVQGLSGQHVIPEMPKQEIPGWAQAALEKPGAVLEDINPADLPWAKQLPGADKVAEAITTVKEYIGDNNVRYIRRSNTTNGLSDAWSIQVYNNNPAVANRGGYWEIKGGKSGVKVSFHVSDAPVPGSVEAKLEDLLIYGAMDKQPASDSAAAHNAQYMLARAMWESARNKGADRFIRQMPDGNWAFNTYQPPPEAHYYAVSSFGTKVTSHIPGENGGKDIVMSPEDLLAVAEVHVTPNAVQIDGKVYPTGFYYKPKGKAHLEIKPWLNKYWHTSAPNETVLTYHQVNGGTKQVSYYYAAKALGDMTDYHAQSKDAPQLATPVIQLATPFLPGSYYQLMLPEGPVPYQVMPDGSSIYKGATFSVASTTTSVHYGNVVDSFGNTVVAPGETPTVVYLFGKKQPGGYESGLQHILGQLQTTGAPVQDVLGIEKNSAESHLIVNWLADHNYVTGTAVKDGVTALVQEMLQAYKTPQLTVEPKYLAGLPSGVLHSGHAFEFNTAHQAKKSGVLAGVTFSNWTMTEKKNLVKTISEQHKGLIGKYVSSLGTDDLTAWLNAYNKGDMVTIFNLDAKAGKVYKAHPGAPGNVGTHQIFWAPLFPGQAPANEKLEGDWSAPDNMPNAEVVNYLIKAGLQHAEHLGWMERRQWVKAHIQNDQDTVDKLSQSAQWRWDKHDQPLTPALEWTANLQPSKSYTVKLESKTPAASWGYNAINDFADDYADSELFKNAVSAYNEEQGNDPDSTYWKSYPSHKQLVVQKYLDLLAAAEEAELKKPRYNLVPGSAGVIADQFGTQYDFEPGDTDPVKQAVADLAHSWGYKLPSTYRVTLEDGTEGSATERLQDAENLLGEDIPGLDPSQLADVAREHVLDWALASPYGGQPASLAKLPGGTITGTAKPESLIHLEWEGLAGDDKADEFAKQAITRIFDAIRAKKIKKADADVAAIAAIQAARRMEKMPDNRFSDFMAKALTEGVEDKDLLAAGSERAAMLLQRKNSLAEDIEDLWARVYKQAKWKLPEIPKEALPYGLHSGFSEPTYFDHVIASKSFGAPAFFNSFELENNNFLTWTELSGQNRLIRGESSVRGSALDALTAWCLANQTAGPSGTGSMGTITPVSVDPDMPKDETANYAILLGAVKSISRHAQDQMWTGPHTSKALENMEALKIKLTQGVEAAEAALAEGKGSAMWDAFQTSHNSHPYLYGDMAKYYLGLIQKAEKMKTDKGTSKPGDYPKWVAPPLPKEETPLVEAPKVIPLKVERKKAVRELGVPANQIASHGNQILGADGELHLSGATHTYPGDAWHITLPTGEEIEVHDSSTTGTPAAHKGRIRYKANASKGSASLENIRQQLQAMGLPLPEATPDDMELFYWRHLAGVLNDRLDRNTGKHSLVWTTLRNEMKAKGISVPANATDGVVSKLVAAGLEPQEELDIWRKAWAQLTSPEQVAQFVADGNFMPYMNHYDVTAPEVENGKPVWYKFNAADDWQWLAGVGVKHNFQNGAADPLRVTRTGGLHSTESRLRALGTSVTGMSSASDTSHGSSGNVFTRLQSPSGASVMLNPRTLARTMSYSFNHDAFGDVGKRKSGSPFDMHTADSSYSYEMCVPDAASLLDDIEVLSAGSASQRQQIINELKARGITTIRGVPVEDRIQEGVHASAMTKARAALKALGAKFIFGRSEVPYQAPPQQKVAVEHAIINTEAELEAQEGGDLAKEVSGKAASIEHVQAAPQAKVSQMFYGQPTKPSGAESSSVKHALAERLAKKMTSTAEQLQAFHDAVGMNNPASWGDTIRERTAAGMVACWAQSNHSPLYHALQQEAAELFGLDPDQLLESLPTAFAGDKEQVTKLRTEFKDVLDDFLRSEWELTQDDFEKAGIENVTLYRIMKWNAGSIPDWAKGHVTGDVIDAPTSLPLSAWGFMQGGATGAGTFGSGSHSILVKTTVPRQLVLSYPKTGQGCYNETEMVAMAAPGKWEVVKGTGQ